MELTGMPRCPPGGQGSVDTLIRESIRLSARQPIRQTGRCRSGAAIGNKSNDFAYFVAKLTLLCVPGKDDAIARKPELEINAISNFLNEY